MRRKISLYIGDRLVDLDDQSFILMNYTMDDLSNPTIIKNSFSQQITLKGTPTNNKIFGWMTRADRKVSFNGDNTGSDFNPSQKTPFTIYNELDEILESGYVKVDSVSRKGADIQYKVTLYGGLGSFFYSLSYDENGNRRTLADLDYLGTSNPESELDFTINAQSVQDAWDRLNGDDTMPDKWKVINFAPAYNGIPEGNFAPDKGLVDPTEVGLDDEVSDDQMTYSTRSGYCLVNLAEAQEEWSVKDLRSYLQRPVLSMHAFWEAICNPANTGGYEVDATAVQESLGNYSTLWMTLPLISSIGAKRTSGDLTLTLTSAGTTGNDVGRYDIGGGTIPSGTDIRADLHCMLRFNVSGADSNDSLYRSVTHSYGTNVLSKFSAIFLQAVAYASDDTIVGGSKVKAVGFSRESGKSLAEACGFVPAFPADYETITIPEFEKVSAGVFQVPGELGFEVEAKDVAYYKILVSVFPGTSSTDAGSGGRNTRVNYTGDGDTSLPVLYEDYDTGYTPTSAFIVAGATSDSISYTSSESLRSGAVITKAMLLSSSHTPADYLLSFAKVLGLYFVYDVATRKVSVLRRNDLYQDETIDLSKRVDLSKGISINPMVFDAKWYDFILEGAGSFHDEYKQVEGIEYGIQRVNTGYDFNSESVNLMEDVVYRNACTILARSRYYNAIFKGATPVFQPSPFVDKGNTYTLWSPTGETIETDIPCPPYNATIEYYNDNPALYGYDINTARKLELRSADNKPVDGEDILVFFEGWDSYDYFKLTDDVPAMDVLNDGVPCWLLGEGQGLRIPIFQRYIYGNPSLVEHSLDFGVPRQFDIPGVHVFTGATIYERAWQKYMEDRYDVNTKVMTCWVDFKGIQVSQDLLRKFYWYDNSLWVINRISNYSLTTYDPVQVELIQVQDKDNYLTGQNFD